MSSAGEASQGAVPGAERSARLIEAAAHLTRGADTETVLGALLEDARELTGAPLAAVELDSEEGRAVSERLVVSGGEGQARERIAQVRGRRREEGRIEIELDVRGEHLGSLLLIAPEGGFGEADLEVARVLGHWAAIALAEHRIRERLRRGLGEAERTTRALEATTSMARAVGGETELDRVLGTIARRARALVEARTVLVLLGDASELELVVAVGETERSALGARAVLGDVGRRALSAERAERLEGAELRSFGRELGVDARAALLAPLRFRGRRLGMIVACDRLADGPDFGPDDVGLLVSFATSAATAVATAQSVASERLRDSIESSERERGRWARELHDETLQAMGALRVMLASALGLPEDSLRSRVASAVEQLDTEIANLRSLISELRPVALDQLGLAEALEELAGHHTEVSGFEVSADVSAAGGLELDAELQSAVYRVIQEALTNVAKHAGAGRASVTLGRRDGSLVIEVADDGAGFDSASRRSGFGLLGMRERVELAGGELAVDSTEGEGTRVSATIPLGGHRRILEPMPGSARSRPVDAAR